MYPHTARSAAFNLACVCTATALAIVLVPAEVQPAGAIRLPSLILAIGLMACFLRRVVSEPVSVFDPLNIVAASPVYWLLLDTLQGTYDLTDITPTEVRGAFLAIGLFSCGVWLAAMQRPWRLPKIFQQATEVRLTPAALFSVALVAFGLAFLRFAIPSHFDFDAMLGVLWKDRWDAPWSRGQLGGWDAFLDHLAYFGYLLPALAVLLGRAVGWFNWRTLAIIICALFVGALFSAGGGRRIIGVMFGSAIAVWFLSARPPRLRHLLALAGLGSLLLWLLQIMLMYRGVGIGHAFRDGPDSEIESLEHIRVDDNFLRTCELVGIMPALHPHAGFKWLLWVAVRPVPRVFWPSKPVDLGFDLASYKGMAGVSLSTSLIGELYMAFGCAGCVVGGWVLGRWATSLREVLRGGPRPGALMLFGSGLLALFVGMRSGIELILMSYVLLAWVALVWARQKMS